MERWIQLHEHLEVRYYVTHYEARLVTEHDETMCSEMGRTVEEAIANLLATLESRFKSVQHLRATWQNANS